MSYSKNTWADGDIITAAKMNNIENGIKGSELPSITGNAGKVLKVNSGANGVEWSEGGGGSVYYPLISNTYIEASYNDIKADITAGKSVYIVQSDYMPGQTAYYMLVMEYETGFDFMGYDANASDFIVLSMFGETADADLYKWVEPA